MRDRSESIASGLEVTPDTPEGRERITRMEERVESNRRQIDALAPLVRQVERVQWHIDELTEDFKQFRLDQREQRVTDEKRREDELRELRRSVADQILVVTDGLKGCSNKIGEVAESVRKHHEAETKRREDEAKTVRIETTQDVVSRRTLYGVLGAAGLASLAALLTPIISALFG